MAISLSKTNIAFAVFWMAFYLAVWYEDTDLWRRKLVPVRIEYTIRNEVSAIDFEDEKVNVVSWEDFEKFSEEYAQKDEDHKNALYNADGTRKNEFTRAECRRILYNYFYQGDRIFMWRYTPVRGDHFRSAWDHLQEVLVTKTAKDMLIQYSMANGNTDQITWKQIKQVFFDLPAPTPGQQLKQPQAKQQNMLLVNLNALAVAMQTYFLQSMKEGIENRGLDEDIFRPRLEVVGSDGTATWYRRAEVLNLHNGPLQQDMIDLCMARWEDCEVKIKAFYLFKQLYEHDNRYTQEMLQDHSLFEPYLPLF